MANQNFRYRYVQFPQDALPTIVIMDGDTTPFLYVDIKAGHQLVDTVKEAMRTLRTGEAGQYYQEDDQLVAYDANERPIGPAIARELFLSADDS